MPTPSNPVELSNFFGSNDPGIIGLLCSVLIFLLFLLAITVTIMFKEQKASFHARNLCERLLEISRVSGGIAYREQRRLVENKARAVSLSEIVGHQGRQRQTRFKQDRAAGITPAKQPSLRFIPMADADLIPPKPDEPQNQQKEPKA